MKLSEQIRNSQSSDTQELKRPTHPGQSKAPHPGQPQSSTTSSQPPDQENDKQRHAAAMGLANTATDQLTTLASTVKTTYDFLNGNAERLADAIYDIHSGRVLEDAIARRLNERVKQDGLPTWATVDFSDAEKVMADFRLGGGGVSSDFLLNPAQQSD